MSTTPGPDADNLLVATLPLVEDAIRFVCRRYRCRTEEAEEFASEARLRLLQDDCAVLRKFGGRSSLRTYLAVVLQRQFLDYRRQHWGNWRPSAEARRLGETAVRLDTLLHRDGLTLDEAVEVLRTNARVAEPEDALRRLAARLPRRLPRRVEGEEALVELGVPAEVVEKPALVDESARRTRALRLALASSLAELEDEDALILRLRFQEDLTVTRIAAALGLESKPLYRRLGRLLERLREGLERRGFGSGDFYDALGSGVWDEESQGRAGVGRANSSGYPPGPC